MRGDPDRKANPQVQESMPVISSEGKLIGYVTKVRKKDFRVHALAGPDLSLPYNLIDTISPDTGITLSLSEQDLALEHRQAPG